MMIFCAGDRPLSETEQLLPEDCIQLTFCVAMLAASSTTASMSQTASLTWIRGVRLKACTSTVDSPAHIGGPYSIDTWAVLAG